MSPPPRWPPTPWSGRTSSTAPAWTPATGRSTSATAVPISAAGATTSSSTTGPRTWPSPAATWCSRPSDENYGGAQLHLGQGPHPGQAVLPLRPDRDAGQDPHRRRHVAGLLDDAPGRRLRRLGRQRRDRHHGVRRTPRPRSAVRSTTAAAGPTTPRPARPTPWAEPTSPTTSTSTPSNGSPTRSAGTWTTCLFMTRISSQWYTDARARQPARALRPGLLHHPERRGGRQLHRLHRSRLHHRGPAPGIPHRLRAGVRGHRRTSAPTVAITSPADGRHPAGGRHHDHRRRLRRRRHRRPRSSSTTAPTYLGEDTTAPYTFTWTSRGRRVLHDHRPGHRRPRRRGHATRVDITVGAGCGQAPYLRQPVRPAGQDRGRGLRHRRRRRRLPRHGPANNGGQYRTGRGRGHRELHRRRRRLQRGLDRAAASGSSTRSTFRRPATTPSRPGWRRLATGGTFHMEFDGVDVTGNIDRAGDRRLADLGHRHRRRSTSRPASQTMRFVPTTTGLQRQLLRHSPGRCPRSCPTRSRSGYALHPCYPNPFNPSTTISYELPVASVGEPGGLRRGGAAGADAWLPVRPIGAGRHEVVWNGRDEAGRAVAGGIYFYRLDADGFSETRRMTLVK